MDKVNPQAAASSWSLPPAVWTKSLRLFRRRRSLLPHGFLLFASLLLAACLHAQDARPTTTQVEAAYLFNFGKFVRWKVERTSSSDSFGICILGKDPFGSVLDSTVAGESIGGKSIAVAKLSRIQDASTCSVLFISSSEEPRLTPILAAAQHQGVLTVSDIPHFIERGGAIGLVTQQNKIRFEVNRKAAEQSGLILSSELLKIAIRVIGKPIPEN